MVSILFVHYVELVVKIDEKIDLQCSSLLKVQMEPLYILSDLLGMRVDGFVHQKRQRKWPKIICLHGKK